MVDGAPEIAELAVNLHERLIQMPPPLRIAAHVHNAPLSDLGGEYRAKPVPPEPDGLVAEVDPSLGQQILDVAQRQRVSHVHHHEQTDDLWRAVEISERIADGPILRRPKTPRALGLTKPKSRVGPSAPAPIRPTITPATGAAQAMRLKSSGALSPLPGAGNRVSSP